MKHSIRVKFTMIFIGLMAAVLVSMWAVNSFFLESFYTKQKLQLLENAYENLNAIAVDKEFLGENITEDLQSLYSNDGEQTEASRLLRLMNDKYNTTIVIQDSITGELIPLAKDGKFLADALHRYILGIIDPRTETLISQDDHQVQKIYDRRSQGYYLQSWGFFDDNRTMFIMSMLFVVMMLGAPFITDQGLLDIDWSVKTFMPTFDAKFFMGLSILVFAVGGCEKISPYVNKMKDPSRDFSKGMVALAVMVALTAILGTIALGMMFDSSHIPQDLMTNGAYYAFQRLGEYYHMGNFFVIVYALTNLVGQFSVMVLSIDAPLRMLLESADRDYIPEKLFVKNENGAYTNGHKLVMAIVAVLIVVPAFGIKNVDVLVRWLIKVNSVCMPLRYLWVFVAYIALKRAGDRFPAAYRFVRGRGLGIFFGIWCFVFTAFACITGIYSEDPFQLVLNIVTPFLLVGLGFILPRMAGKERRG